MRQSVLGRLVLWCGVWATAQFAADPAAAQRHSPTARVSVASVPAPEQLPPPVLQTPTLAPPRTFQQAPATTLPPGYSNSFDFGVSAPPTNFMRPWADPAQGTGSPVFNGFSSFNNNGPPPAQRTTVPVSSVAPRGNSVTLPPGAMTIQRGMTLPGNSFVSQPDNIGMSPGRAYLPPISVDAPPEGAFTLPASPGFAFDDPNNPTGVYDQVFAPGVPYSGPRLFGGIGGLVMTRSQVNSRTLTLSPTGFPVLDMRDSINHPWQGGFEARLGSSVSARSAIEATFWLLAPFHGVANVTSAADGLNSTMDFVTGGPLIIDGRPATDFFFNSHIQQFERTSQVWNLELNGLRFFADPTTRLSVTAMAGVRWFHFRETGDYAASTAGTTFGQFDGGNVGHYLNTVTNELVGPQFGARMHYQISCPLRVYVFPKVAVLGNAARLDSQLHCGCADGGTDGFSVSSFVGNFSMLGQLDAGVSWQATQRISLYASYRMVGVSGLAVVDDQFRQVVSEAVRNPLINTAGSLILQGAVFGGQLAF